MRRIITPGVGATPCLSTCWQSLLHRSRAPRYASSVISGIASTPTARPDGYGYGPRPAKDERSPGSPPDGTEAEKPPPEAKRGGKGRELTAEQQQMVSELQARDREVRAHEAAHKAVGGSLSGSMSFSYQTGPDGRRYAVGGEVSIDTGSERDPQATIAKMRQVIAAALAPANPSAQDRAVAAAARATMAEAQRQLSEQQRSETKPADDQGKPETKAEKTPDRAARGYGQQAEATGGLISLIA